jgi:hypothetical protein
MDTLYEVGLVMNKIDSIPFIGWQNVITSILSLFDEGLSIDDIMTVLRLSSPQIYSKGPLGGKTVRNTCSNAITVGIRKGVFKVVDLDIQNGRIYTVK